jgi:glutathione S-transferase
MLAELPRPILYSFRRCPYAIRARLALLLAGKSPGQDFELREVSLKAKPPELLERSAKATVPLLELTDGTVLAESMEIMQWALALPSDLTSDQATDQSNDQLAHPLLVQNDGPFKHHLDRFKYPDRYPGVDGEHHRVAAESILGDWDGQLAKGWLLGDQPSWLDWAVLPFVRQWRLADPDRFDRHGGLERLRSWLQRFEEGPELAAVMAPPWVQRQAWRSPQWVYHLALADEWRTAKACGEYRRSTRGLSLEQVGFIHASGAHQVEATFRRFYADAEAVLLLTLDPGRMDAPLRWEATPPSDELFPHIYGPLPVGAVRLAEPFGPVLFGLAPVVP